MGSSPQSAGTGDGNQSLMPDLAMAARHLMLLDEEAEFFTFQTFTDAKDRPRPDPLAQIRHGGMEDLGSWLAARNQAGAGVFVTVNATDGHGRSLANITRVRAVWQECDRGDEPPLPVEPHLSVESSPGKRHHYVMVEGLPIDLFEAVQQRLVDDYGSDPSAKDRARVLRLAGFYHLKDPTRTHRVVIVHESARQPTPWGDLQALMPPVARPHADQADLPPEGTSPPNVPEIRSALATLDPDLGYLAWLKVGMALHATGGGLAAFTLWDAWSQTGTLYRPGETAYRWRSFSLERDQAITLKSLWSLAYDAGWRGRNAVEILADAKTLERDAAASAIKSVLGEAARLDKLNRRRVHEAVKRQTGLPFGLLRDIEGELPGGKTEDPIDQLALAQGIRATIGPENLIGQESGTWRYRHQHGIWRLLVQREERQLIQRHLEKAQGRQEIAEVGKGLIDGVTDLFRSECYVRDHQWDRGSDEAVSTPIGVLALDRGQWVLRPHCREDFRTVQVPVVWDPKAEAPRFAQFLVEVFAPDPDWDLKSRAILEMLGYSLMAHARHERFVILVGEGANGKSVLLAVLERLCGIENIAGVQPSQFDRAFQRAHLHLKLANIVTELKQGEVIADAELKGITSGEPSTVEHKFQTPFTMRPYATCWFGANHLPHTRDFSFALFRRALVVRFNRKFIPGIDADPHLKDRLFEELPGILRLALSTYAEALVHGFTEPPSCALAKEEWRREADQAMQFIEEATYPGGEVGSSELFEAYRQWAGAQGIRQQLSHKGLADRLARLGYAKAKDGAGRVRYHGLRVLR